MSIDNKYRVHEVAKDFKRPTKEITEILTKYATTPKNHMQALTDEELSIIFAYLTVHNQVEDMASIFETEVYHEPKAAVEEAPTPAVEAPEAAKAAPQAPATMPAEAGQAAAAKPATPAKPTQPPGPSPPNRPSSGPPPGCPRSGWWTPARAARSTWRNMTSGWRTSQRAAPNRCPRASRSSRAATSGATTLSRAVSAVPRSRRRCAASTRRSPRSTLWW